MNKALSEKKYESYKIFDKIAGTYDFLNHFLSLGIDIYWRQKFLKNLPSKNNMKALDLATGTGDVAIVLAKDPRVAKVVGIDLSQGMIELGRKKIKKKELEHKAFLQMGDAVKIPCADGSFDLVTISFGIRNFYDPQASLVDIYRVLAPTGRTMIMEFSVPKNIFIRWSYFFYFRNILPFIGNIISRHRDAYTYLNKTVEDFPYGNEFAKLMTTAGFQNIQVLPLTWGIATLYIGEKNL